MTSTAIDRIANTPSPSRVGQATSIEQSRAVAEVQAAVYVAQQFPRNVHAAIAAMRESCASKSLAEKAFFRFPRGGQSVSGESIHLARELARCWTNVDYGIKELSRNDDIGESEMLAWAWDVQANTRVSNTFIVKHQRDKRGGPEKLVDLRDIYENNANNGARRVRECIFGVLPPSFIEEAKELCAKTLQDGGGVPLAQRVADAIRVFAEIGVTADQLEAKLGRASAQWTAHDLGQLSITYSSLKSGTITRDEEFPQQRVTVDEITASKGRKKAEPAADEPDSAELWPEAAKPAGE